MTVISRTGLELLIHAGASDTTAISDASPRSRTCSVSGSFVKTGTDGIMPSSSTRLGDSGTPPDSDSYLSVNVDTVIALTNKDFTFDFWWKPATGFDTHTTSSYYILYGRGYNSSTIRPIYIFIDPARGSFFSSIMYGSNRLTHEIPLSNFTAGTWTHIGICRSKAKSKLYVAGNLKSDKIIGANDSTPDINRFLIIGAGFFGGSSPDEPVWGVLDEIRLSIGTFTDFASDGVPTSPYTYTGLHIEKSSFGEVHFGTPNTKGAFVIEKTSFAKPDFVGTGTTPEGKFEIDYFNSVVNFNSPGPFKIDYFNAEITFTGIATRTGKFSIDSKMLSDNVSFSGTAEQVNIFSVDKFSGRVEFTGKTILPSAFVISEFAAKCKFDGYAAKHSSFVINSIRPNVEFMSDSTPINPLRFIKGELQ